MGIERAASELLLRVARLVGRFARLDDFAVDLEELYLTRRERNKALAMGWLLGQLIRSPLALRPRAVTPRRRSLGDLWHAFAARAIGEGWWLDARHSARSLRRSPWYSATVVAVLTVGLTAASVTFAIVDGVLFKPLLYPKAHELYLIRAVASGAPRATPPPVSWDEIRAWRDAAPDLRIGVASAAATRIEQSAVRDYYGARIDEQFLDVLGVRPLRGGLTDDDHSRSRMARPIVSVNLLTHALWTTLHGGDVDVIGRSVVVGRYPDREVIGRIAGVLPPDFVFPTAPGQPEPSVLEPLGPDRATGWANSAAARTLQAIVRVTDPGSVQEIETRLTQALARLAEEQTPPAIVHGHVPVLAPALDRVTLVPLSDHLGGDSRRGFLAAASAASLLLLLVCLNVSGLATARAAIRKRDAAVRCALGASIGRLRRLQALEIVWLVAPACVAALMLCAPFLRITVDLLPASLPLFKTPTIDARVVAAAAVLGGLSTLLVVFWPAQLAGRIAAASTVWSGSGGPTTRSGPRHWIVAGQTAGGFVLVVVATLTGGSFIAAWREDTGYDRSRLALLETYASFYATQQEATDQLLDTWQRLRRVPGVADVAVSSIQPLFRSAQDRSYTGWAPATAPEDVTGVSSRSVSSNYFAVMGLGLVDGTWPEARAWDANAAIGIVSESAARRWWPGRSAVGQQLLAASERARETTAPRVVVAVVRDARYSALDLEPSPAVYVPAPIETSTYGVFFLARTNVPVDDALPGLRQASSVHRLRLAQAIGFEAALFESVRHRALSAWLFGLLGGAGLVVLGTGVLGLLAMSVSQRSREMGIRCALGATGAGIVGLLMREQMRAVVAGLVVGGAAAVLAARAIDSRLYGVQAFDATPWITAVAVVLFTALAGTLIPSLRSVTTKPAEILRSE